MFKKIIRKKDNMGVDNNTSGATIQWSWSCHARGTASHVMYLKPWHVENRTESPLEWAYANLLLKNCLQR